MKLEIQSDESLLFSAENTEDQEERGAPGEGPDLCLLTVKEVTIETEMEIGQLAIVLTEGDCENLINVLCGWHARINAARKEKSERRRDV